MTEPIRYVYLDGCDVGWDDAKVNSSDTVFDGDDVVTFSLYESDYPTSEDKGTVLTGADGISMSYVAGSNGKFVGHLAASVSLVFESYYVLKVTATPDGGTPHTRHAIVQAIYRNFNP